MDYDIIIYALVAVLILARLWTVLGQRGGDDRTRINPFAARPPTTLDAGPTAIAGPQRTETPLLLKPMQLAPDSLAGGLASIRVADPTFDEKQFLQKVRAAFTTILAGFAKGDLTEAAPFLHPVVLAQFKDAVEARQQAGQSMDHRLVAIREAECVTAKSEGNHATITVRFVSQQETTLRDSLGAVLDNSGKTEEITDLWVFARDVKADPNWILVETKS